MPATQRKSGVRKERIQIQLKVKDIILKDYYQVEAKKYEMQHFEQK
jgi:hypothetical protein